MSRLLSSNAVTLLLKAVNTALTVGVAYFFFKSFWKRARSSTVSLAIAAAGVFIVFTAFALFDSRAFTYVMLFSAFMALSYMFDTSLASKVLLSSILTAVSYTHLTLPTIYSV